MWEIIREAATDPFAVRYDGVTVDTAATYDLAVASLGDRVTSGLVALAAAGVAPTGGDGLLPERWVNVEGIAMSEDTGDGRDFSATEWSSRDVKKSTLPLMLQTVNQGGHYGAVWVGYFETIDPGDKTQASGRFYDNVDGVRARDMMLSKPVGISVDAGPNTEAEFVCTEVDEEWGDCIDGNYVFLTYEIIGATITPFPAFARAAIQLETPAAAASAEIVRIVEEGENNLDAMADEFERVVTAAAIEIPDVVPGEWFRMPEPEIGDPLLVRQPPQYPGDPVEHWAVPLTVTDDGMVYGHAAREGQCHVGIRGECVTAPMSATNYAFFHLGVTRTTDGDLPTGVLIAACDHYPTTGRTNGAARKHYDNTDLQWADVRASNGVHGVWVCGALRQDVTPAQLRVIRASTLSGDWEDRGGNLEMIAAQCVSVPGFPVLREWIAASGLSIPEYTGPKARSVNGRVLSLSAAGVVRRPCSDCAARAANQRALREARTLTAGEALSKLGGRLDRIEQMLARIDRRTEPMREAAVARLVDKITRKGVTA